LQLSYHHAAPINSQQKKKTNKASHSSCTWYINEYNFTHRLQLPSPHGRKRKQTRLHTVAAHGISMNTASHTRLQLSSPHGRKENTPTFHTVAAHGLLQLQLDIQGNNSHQLMA